MTALSSPAFANCALQPDGVTVVCNTNAPNPYTSSINAITVGSGTLVIPTNGAKVIVNAGAGIATTGAAIQVSNNSSVMNAGSISTTFINAYGMWAGDPNNASSTTTGFGNTLENDGSIKTTGSNSVGIFARTANRTAGNTLINRGRIDTYGSISGTSPRSSSAGIRSDSVVASTILNYGIVAAHGTYATIASGNTVAIAGNGVEMAGPGTFTNEAGATVTSDNAYGFYANGPNANGITVINAGSLSGSRGAILFGAGQSNNTVMLEAGSTTTGSIDAGTGGSNNTLVFDGYSSTAFANAIPNWQLVALRNAANVTFSAANYALSNLSLDAGTTATFATPALSITGQITDNGTLVFDSPNNLTIAASIQGSGALTQAGDGTLLLTGASTYTGATTVASGTLQAGGANVLAPASAFSVNSGATLDLGNANQTIGSLAGAGAVTLGAGTLTTGGLGSSTSFGGVIAGSGALMKTGAGTMTLTGASTYTGGTTIGAGILQLGDGGNTGSIVGDVTDNGSLIFNRSDVSTFAGAIAGSGSVTQQGSGTTVLTGNEQLRRWHHHQRGNTATGRWREQRQHRGRRHRQWIADLQSQRHLDVCGRDRRQRIGDTARLGHHCAHRQRQLRRWHHHQRGNPPTGQWREQRQHRRQCDGQRIAGIQPQRCVDVRRHDLRAWQRDTARAGHHHSHGQQQLHGRHHDSSRRLAAWQWRRQRKHPG